MVRHYPLQCEEYDCGSTDGETRQERLAALWESSGRCISVGYGCDCGFVFGFSLVDFPFAFVWLFLFLGLGYMIIKVADDLLHVDAISYELSLIMKGRKVAIGGDCQRRARDADFAVTMVRTAYSVVTYLLG